MKTPQAEKRPHVMSTHGDTRIDNYYWLRDDQRTDPQVLAYLEQENAYSDAVMAPHEARKRSLYGEMVKRIPSTDMSVPYVRKRLSLPKSLRAVQRVRYLSAPA